MSEAKSVGPRPAEEEWTALPDPDGDGSYFVRAMRNGCEVWLAYGLTREAANLIAAAPKMVEALEATQFYVETLEKVLRDDTDPGAPKIRAHAEMIRAALSKAKGG